MSQFLADRWITCLISILIGKYKAHSFSERCHVLGVSKIPPDTFLKCKIKGQELELVHIYTYRHTQISARSQCLVSCLNCVILIQKSYPIKYASVRK